MLGGIEARSPAWVLSEFAPFGLLGSGRHRPVGSGTNGGGVLDGLRVLRLRGGGGAAGAHHPSLPPVPRPPSGKQFNERSAGVLNREQYPFDVIALVVLWRLHYRLTLRDLGEMFLQRDQGVSHEAVRGWEAKLAPLLAGELRRRRSGRGVARGRGPGTWTGCI